MYMHTQASHMVYQPEVFDSQALIHILAVLTKVSRYGNRKKRSGIKRTGGVSRGALRDFDPWRPCCLGSWAKSHFSPLEQFPCAKCLQGT